MAMLDLKKTLARILSSMCPVGSRVSYRATGDVSFTSWIPFNTVEWNVGGGTWSSGQYVVPKAGYYLVNFTCFSNAMNQGRPTVQNLQRGEKSMANNNYTTSITAVFWCEVGDKLVAGAYNSSYPVSLYAGAGHNSFTVYRLAG